uniref:Uncharacterized protein n=1 Tax=viral metagenome TaxID=1070528 RepID=A0A6C0EKM9_9ZZZZ
MIAYAGACNAVIKYSGAANLQGQVMQLASNATYSCTDMLNCSSTGELEIDSWIVSDNSPATNGLHITGDGVNLAFSGTHFHTASGGYDILVDPALTGTGSQITIIGELIRDKISVPSGYKSTAVFVSAAIDKGTNNDVSYVIDGETQIGSVENPSELAVGEGDSIVQNMFVFSYNGSTYTDNTTAARSRTGSTFPLFSAVTAGNIAYIGNSGRQFPSMKFNISGTAMAIGAGAIVLEYWNGAWTSVHFMDTLADYPYTQNDGTLLATVADHQVRIDTSILATWTTTTVNSQSGYWLRFRITSDITTSVVLERIKLSTNHTEINRDGFMESFGNGEATSNLRIGTAYLSRGAPSSYSLNVSSGISSLTRPYSEFNNSSFDGHAYVVNLEKGIDTSRAFTLQIRWAPTTNNAGNVEITFIHTTGITTGDNVDAGTITQTADTSITAVTSSTIGVLYETNFTFYVSSLFPNQNLIIEVSRDARSSNPNDTLNGGIVIFDETITVYRWRP